MLAQIMDKEGMMSRNHLHVREWKPTKEEEEDDKTMSTSPCPYCLGVMSVGEEKAGGVCTTCYFQEVNHDAR